MPTPPPAEDDPALVRRLRLVSLLEAGTLLALVLVAVPLKHALGHPEATRIMGPVHGAAFVAYIWCVVATVSGGGWTRTEVVRLVLAAFIPFGGFANAGFLRRREAAARRREGWEAA